MVLHITKKEIKLRQPVSISESYVTLGCIVTGDAFVTIGKSSIV